MKGVLIHQLPEKHKHAARKFIKLLPGEGLHRAASYVIIAEAAFHTFHRILPIVIGGVVYIVVEIIAIALTEE